MKQFTINDLEFSIPEGYQDLKQKDFRKICQLLATNTPEVQLITLYYFLKLRWWSFKRRKHTQVVKLLSADWVHTLLTDSKFLGWIFTSTPIKQYFISKFWHRGMLYVGPPKNILKINASEFVFAYTFFKQYSANKNEKHIDQLIAVLYREPNVLFFLKIFSYGYSGDKRLALNNYLFERRIKRISSLPADIKLGIFMQFASAWEQFEKREEYKYIFQKTAESDNKKDDPFLWEKIMMKMAEGGTFGNYNEVQLMDKDRFFLCMQKNIEEYLAAKDAR